MAIPSLAFRSPKISESPPLAADIAVAPLRIVVACHLQLSEKNLQAARPAPWAVLGNQSRERDRFSADLRLVARPAP